MKRNEGICVSGPFIEQNIRNWWPLPLWWPSYQCPSKSPSKGRESYAVPCLWNIYPMNTVDTRTYRESLNSQMIIVRSTGPPFPQTLWLDKSQHSSATCEVVPLYQKEPCPESLAEGTNGYLWRPNTCWPPGSLSITSICYTFQSPCWLLSALLPTPTLNFSSSLECCVSLLCVLWLPLKNKETALDP